MIKVAVIAGTPVDTQMGVDYIEAQNAKAGKTIAEPLYRPVAEDCDDQVRFQYSDDDNKRKKMDEIFDPAIEQGVKDFFIYCNSLSGAFDFDEYAAQKGVRVFTPLQIYRNLGKKFDRVGVVCANNLSAYNIEKNLLMTNDDLYVIGAGNMAIVSAIEEGLPADKIVDICGLRHMVRYMETCGCEALILGCTHFPYVVEELKKFCKMPVIDPADEMFSAMTGEQ
jgi:glutamate racemase